jgi:hypothetical protein
MAVPFTFNRPHFIASHCIAVFAYNLMHVPLSLVAQALVWHCTFCPIWLIVLCVPQHGWLIKWRWFAPVKLRPLLHSGLIWQRQTLIAYLIVASLFYLVISAAARAPRNQADAHFRTYLQRGEISLLSLK